MKKIFKNKRFQNIMFFILGAVIFGSVGIVATTNRLEAKYVMYTKDGETMTVQDAIKDLYVLAKNKGGSNQTLPIGDVSVKSLTVKIPYTGTYKDIKCLYGTDENYGKLGSINSNICTFMGTNGNQKLYYKIIASNDDGKIYEVSGSVTTGIETNIIKTDIPTGTKAIIYLDPTDLSKDCNESNSTVGSGTSGCMKWYAFKEDDTSYTMILDHNTMNNAKWDNSMDDEGQFIGIRPYLEALKSSYGWETDAFMWEYSSIIKELGLVKYSPFDQRCKNAGDCTPGMNKYWWLFDFVGNCTTYGCKMDGRDKAFWVGSVGKSMGKGYVVNENGKFDSKLEDSVSGVRPSITVPKSNL